MAQSLSSFGPTSTNSLSQLTQAEERVPHLLLQRLLHRRSGWRRRRAGVHACAAGAGRGGAARRWRSFGFCSVPDAPGALRLAVSGTLGARAVRKKQGGAPRRNPAVRSGRAARGGANESDASSHSPRPWPYPSSHTSSRFHAQGRTLLQ
ncbi:hypothetical protein GW17_00017630 [Ensete ventricosum]|uniref:Uncharacterized protein n=1 Tax=Ensete ventricosum TaxID=4639 RepID=A0A444F6X3_ENSVE|nr:hypothetical protein B296_00041010 [Ensete ventricosum]RWW18391.1 hypothetical protein GW17_00017630 [Ensete ventricosum]